MKTFAEIAEEMAASRSNANNDWSRQLDRESSHASDFQDQLQTYLMQTHSDRVAVVDRSAITIKGGAHQTQLEVRVVESPQEGKFFYRFAESMSAGGKWLGLNPPLNEDCTTVEQAQRTVLRWLGQ